MNGERGSREAPSLFYSLHYHCLSGLSVNRDGWYVGDFCYICGYDFIVSTMDYRTLEFVTYCISKLAHTLQMSQREVYRRLIKSGILYDYIVPSYDVLHTFGSRYLMEDLTDYMREKGVLDR